MILVPHRLLDLPTVNVLFYNEKSTILHKRLYSEIKQRESYVSAPALSIVLRGRQLIHAANGETIILHAGQMCLMQKGIYTISDLIPDGENYESLVIFFEEKNIQEIFPTVITHISTKQLAKSNCPPTLPIFVKGLLASHKVLGRFDTKLGQAKITELLCLLKTSNQSETFAEVFATPQENIRRDLSQFMENHFDKPLKVEDYAYLTGRSLTAFRRDFKVKYQTTPQAWLKSRRLKRAQNLLVSQKITVTDTAYAVGYQNVSHFIKAFKDKYGLSPKQYVVQNTTEYAKTI